jgi:hypothetical protein
VKEPLRLRDDPSVSDDLRSVLRAGLSARAMTPSQRDRTTKRVAALAALPVAAGSLLGWKGAALAAMAIGTGTLAAASFGPWRGDAAEETAAPVVVSSAAPSPPPVPAPAAPLPDPDPEVESAPAPEASAAATASSPAPPKPTGRSGAPAVEDTLSAEAAVLERARSRAASDPAGSLAILEEHAREFPKGKLSVERELIAVDVLRRTGRASEARARGEALLARTRGGLYEERVRALLQSLP